MSPRRPSEHRGLTMPPGRRIPRTPTPRPPRPSPPGADDGAPGPGVPLEQAGADLAELAGRVRACEACGRACPDRAFGSGSPRAPIFLVKEAPSAGDLASGASFTEEAEALQLAFDRLGIPFTWAYGTSAVRCGEAAADPDEVKACGPHLLVELEAVRPRVVVAFGARSWDALHRLDGSCGLLVPEEIVRGETVSLRAGLVALRTEPLPQGVREAEAKRRLWGDLKILPGLLEGGQAPWGSQ